MLAENGFHGVFQRIQECRSIVFMLGRNVFRGENTVQWFGSLPSTILTYPMVLRLTPTFLMGQLLDDFLRDDKIQRQNGAKDIHDLVKQCIDAGKQVRIITDSCSDSLLSFGVSTENIIFLRGSVKEVLDENTPVRFVASSHHTERLQIASSFVKTVPDDTLFVCVETANPVFATIQSNIPITCPQVYIGAKEPLGTHYMNSVIGDPNQISAELSSKVNSFV